MTAEPVREFLEHKVRQGLFPGATFAFGNALKTVSGSVGRLGYGQEWPETDESTRYDLASLTKVLATTPVVRLLCLEGSLSLEARVTDVLPEFQFPDVTVEHLLRHESGLPAYAYPDETVRTPGELSHAILSLEREHRPGETTVYSCVGFIVLQMIVERVGGRSLDVISRDLVFSPLGMTDTTFGPIFEGLERTAPTSRLEPWHDAGQGWLRGQVHDPLAYRKGGVSGNAGVFGTAHDVATFCQAILQNAEPWSPWIARKEGHVRALGWDLKSATGSSAGARMSGNSFGHTGFTGTSIWIDPDIGFFAVLLTNAVHPLGMRTDLRAARSGFADLALATSIP